MNSDLAWKIIEDLRHQIYDHEFELCLIWDNNNEEKEGIKRKIRHNQNKLKKLEILFPEYFI